MQSKAKNLILEERFGKTHLQNPTFTPHVKEVIFYFMDKGRWLTPKESGRKPLGEIGVNGIVADSNKDTGSFHYPLGKENKMC